MKLNPLWGHNNEEANTADNRAYLASAIAFAQIQLTAGLQICSGRWYEYLPSTDSYILLSEEEQKFWNICSN